MRPQKEKILAHNPENVMRRIIQSFILLTLIIQCDSIKELQQEDGYYHIQNKNIELVLDAAVKGMVFNSYENQTTRSLIDKPDFAVIADGKEIGFVIKKVLLDSGEIFGGKAQIFNVHAKDDKGLGLSLLIKLTAPEKYENTLISQIEIINNSNGALTIDTLISHRYTLQAQDGDVSEDQAPFWAFCGGNYEERFDWIEPMKDGFYRENPMHPTGGNPYTGVWNPEYGIGIMSLELRQVSLIFPVMREADSKVNICIKEPVKRKLKPGQHWSSSVYAVLTHNGDVYNGLEVWSDLLQVRGMKFPESPKSSFDPIWCSWGYEDDYTSDEVLSTLPVAREMDIKWAVLDAGWYDRDTYWDLHPKKYPNGDASMRAFTDSVKALGMRPKLWIIPATAPYGWPEGRRGKKGPLVVPDESMMLLDEDGNTVDLQWFGVSILCPADEAVVDFNKAFISKAMNVWGFEGFKVDGEYLNQFPPCYNPAHKHDDPLESVYAGSMLLKAMYDEALSNVPDAVFEICACGTNSSIYNLTASNQTVSSDPLSSWQIRHRGKIYHALLGSKVAYYGDHVELADGKNDFASTIGVGGVPGTKFTLVETRKMEEGSKLLTAENKQLWARYFEAYATERPSQGHYLNLYDIAYDHPEIHVLQKEDVYYYGVFSKGEFKGKISMKGLAPDVNYQIIDYINNKILFSDITGNANEINVEFDKSLLIKAVPVL